MFRPRHAYRSPITNRYRGKAKGCPVFNNLNDINSSMVEHHDECLECLAKIKNRTDLYRTLADNNKPSNNVIKSLQRLSSSASNNRLKTCLQFLIIKVNEKSILTPHQQTTTTTTTTTTSGTNGSISNSNSPKSNEVEEFNHHLKQIPKQTLTATATTKHYQNGRRQKLHHNQQLKQQRQQSQKKPKQNQLASPPQDQVSSTQDQVGPAQGDHDCQTSLLMLITTQVDDDNQIQTVVPNDDDKQLQNSPPIKDHEDLHNFSAQTQSSPSLNYASTTTTTTTTTTTNTSPSLTETIDGVIIGNSGTNNSSGSSSSSSSKSSSSINSISNICNNNSNERRKTNGNKQIDIRHDDEVSRKRKKIHNNSEHDTSSTASWSSSYTSPPSPISTSSNSSVSSVASSQNSSSCSSSSSSSSPSLSPSPSPLSSPDIINELKGPRLKLSEGKLRKITKRPILFDDYFTEHSFASTPTTSSGCSPGQHSNTTQNSDQSRSGLSLTNNVLIHTFQAPPKFVNNLKPCNLPTKPQEPSPKTTTPPAPTKEMLNCAICGIKERPPNISKIYGQNSCSLCTRFFATFLKRPQQLYCAQDGDCLMTFDSRCQACWIKICLQKFDIEDEHRKIGQKYSPKLLSSPNVSLITIDTSLSR